jgi:hypothetical protein
MNGLLKRLLPLTVAIVAMAPSAAASDSSDVQAVIRKWVADFNKADFKSFLGACDAKAAIVDGFPPYAWTTCAAWIADYESNNKALQATHGSLTIGKVIYEEVNAGKAYVIYPAVFRDEQKGKPVEYKGTWTMTLRKVKGVWLFTGSASAWGVNTL